MDDDVEYVVRRLTVVETERLQGFPDNHTSLVGCDPDEIIARMPQCQEADEASKKALERKVRRWCKETPDGPRYKCTGNSMATPVMRWIGERIQLVSDIVDDLGRIGDGAPDS